MATYTHMVNVMTKKQTNEEKKELPSLIFITLITDRQIWYVCVGLSPLITTVSLYNIRLTWLQRQLINKYTEYVHFLILALIIVIVTRSKIM